MSNNKHTTGSRVSRRQSTALMSDAGATEHVVSYWGPAVAYIPGRGWRKHDGRRFVPEPLDWHVVRAARALPVLAPLRKRLESVHGIRSVTRLAESHPSVAVDPAAFDADPMVLNLENGELNLLTGALSPHSVSSRLTKLGGCTFDPLATAPRWEAFVHEVACGRPALIAYLQVVVGYCLTGLTSEHLLWILLGHGSNGKSVFLAVLRQLLGDYAGTVDPELFVATKASRHPTGLADLEGLRLAMAAELNADEKFDEALVKRATGEDELAARRMHQDFFTFQSKAKVMLAMNAMPQIDGADEGIWRRLRVVPFEHKPKKPDHFLLAALKSERSGILNWALIGLQEYLRSGFPSCPEVDAATAAYRASSDIVGEFLQAMATPSANAVVTAKGAYEKFFAYCLANDLKSPGTRAFHRAMGAHGHATAKVAHGGVRGYRGLTIK